MSPLSRRERLRRAAELPPELPPELPKPPQAETQFEIRGFVDPDFDPFDSLRKPFADWFDARVHLDADGVALHSPPHWSTAGNHLHADCCAWMSEHVETVPPTRDEFRSLLRELGCDIRKVHDVQLVSYVGLKDDVQAHEAFQQLPLPEPHDPHEVLERVWRALEKLPVPAPVIATCPDGTPLPPGVRLISWAPKELPVRLSLSEEVVAVPGVEGPERFVAMTLKQLQNEMAGRHWLGGGWGGVPALIDTLAAVGVIVTVDEPPRPGGGGK